MTMVMNKIKNPDWRNTNRFAAFKCSELSEKDLNSGAS